jgi:HTH-type transcriptional regulator/antitoxin HipB
MREHLRALRKQQGLTQAQLGAQLGVSQARIAEIEANPGLVSFEQILQLLAHLGSGLALETTTPEPAFRTQIRYAFPEASTPGYVKDKGAEPIRKKPLQFEYSSGKTVTDEPGAVKLAFSFKKKKGSW